MDGDVWQRNIFGEIFPKNKSIQPKDNFPNWPLWESILKGEREDRVKTKRERFLAEADSGKKEDEQRFFQRARIFFLEDPRDLDEKQIATMKGKILERSRPVEKNGFGWGWKSVDLFRDSWILVVAPKPATLRQLILQLSKNPKAVDKSGSPYSRAEYHDMIQQRLVVNVNWLADCGRQKKLVHPRPYLWRTFKAPVAKRMSRKRPRPAPPPTRGSKLLDSFQLLVPQAAPEAKRPRISGTPPCNEIFLKEFAFLIHSADLVNYATEKGKDAGRQRAKYYKIAHIKLRRYGQPLDSEEAVEEFCRSNKLFGTTREKFLEIFRTGHCKKAEVLRGDPEILAKMELKRVWGIGPENAKTLFKSGVVGLDDLRKRLETGDDPIHLTSMQKIGLKYFDEFAAKMPRKEATAIGEKVNEVLQEVSPGATLDICGSYRRGASTCGDVDVLMCAGAEADRSVPNLGEIVARLRDSGFLTDADLPLPDKVGCKSSYMGVCVHRGIHRRIDLKVFPISLRPFALLHFTGSGLYNRGMRAHIKNEMSWTLSEDGIEGRMVGIKDCKTEKDIFDVCKIDYKEPEERILWGE